MTDAAPRAQTDDDYLEQRRLRSGAAGWLLLASLGVAYVISGDFAGWNFGLAEGGWGGLLIATALMATMYACMIFGLAELSSAIPATGGGYAFARRALGPWGGFLTGTAILLEYAIAPAAIATFIGGYVESLELFGITNGWPVWLACYVIFVGVHLLGVGEALRVLFVITAVAALALVAFFVGMIPKFDVSNLTNIAPNPDAAGSSSFLPEGWLGIWAAFPFAIWFFLAIEGVPMAAEESRNPRRDLPRGLIAAMGTLLLFAALMLLLAAGGAGADALKASDNPLPTALREAYGGNTLLADAVNYVGLAGLIASFFSIIFGYSRQLFALSRAGYLPTGLSVTSRRKVPFVALVAPGVIGFALVTIVEDGNILINMAVFGATISYVLMTLSHIVLRRREPGLERPYVTPGGTLTTGVALVLAMAAVVATFLVDTTAALIMLGVYGLFCLYFAVHSRHRLRSSAPEEEFAAIQEAEMELAGS